MAATSNVTDDEEKVRHDRRRHPLIFTHFAAHTDLTCRVLSNKTCEMLKQGKTVLKIFLMVNFATLLLNVSWGKN
jgi:hypothetical protein